MIDEDDYWHKSYIVRGSQLIYLAQSAFNARISDPVSKMKEFKECIANEFKDGSRVEAIQTAVETLKLAKNQIIALQSEVDACRFFHDSELELFRELWAEMKVSRFSGSEKFHEIVLKIKALEEMVDETNN